MKQLGKLNRRNGNVSVIISDQLKYTKMSSQKKKITNTVPTLKKDNHGNHTKLNHLLNLNNSLTIFGFPSSVCQNVNFDYEMVTISVQLIKRKIFSLNSKNKQILVTYVSVHFLWFRIQLLKR